ncbi:MAG: hypothetical protein JOS17DRAFT_322974 [Linnemannia elongata]|nr:MAG: hypothetical protein JOS17DRAFT_322974 [Linnemannia elongata]
MSFSSSYPDSLSSETSLQVSSPPDSRRLTNDGRRTISQPENTAKRARLSNPASTIETSLQDDQCIGGEPSSSFVGPFAPSFQIPLSVNSVFSLDVETYASLESAVLTLREQRMEEYKQDVYIAPMAKPNLQAPDESVFPLLENVKEFLAGDGQVMLILGDSGAGKSTFNRYLEHQLWKDYKTGGSIPLFINLPCLKKPEKKLVAEQLKTFNFLAEQIRELKLHRQFTLVCDGYDESQLTSNLHTTNSLNQSGQWDTKLIITCRSQYLGVDYRSRFVPDVRGKYFQPANELFRVAVIAPFSKDQIEDYVEQYVPLEPRPWVTEDYMDMLRTIPNLMDLVKNPFLLSLCLEALPSAIEGKTDLSRVQVTRVQLYDNFVRHWMGVNKRRLQRHKLSEISAESLEGLLDDGFEKAGIRFQQDLAAAIFLEQDGRPVVEYSHRRDKGTWKSEFFGPDPEATLLRGSSLLNRNANQFRFVHRSVLEYFYSRTICLPTSNIGEFDPLDHFVSSSALLSVADHPLSRRNLVTEPSIIQFLAERVRSTPEFEQHLHSLIKRSKTEVQAGRAAANAMTILVRAGARFNGAKLRGIRIPGADVFAGQFDTAQFHGADLTGVNFTKTWIRQADFTGAQMEGVQFGELAYLTLPAPVRSCAFSPDGKYFVGGLRNGAIVIFSLPVGIKQCSYGILRRVGPRWFLKDIALK